MTDHNPICEPIDMQETIRTQQATIERLKGRRDRVLNADTLAAIIRKVDGNHTLGAGELAERIIKELEAGND